MHQLVLNMQIMYLKLCIYIVCCCIESMFNSRKRQKTDESTYTLAHIRSAMANFSDSELIDLCSMDVEPAVVGSVKLFHLPVYVGGRLVAYLYVY